MYHSFERIINDTMLACEAYNHMPNDNDLELDYMPEYEDTWIDADTDYPEDMQGEEDFA